MKTNVLYLTIVLALISCNLKRSDIKTIDNNIDTLKKNTYMQTDSLENSRKKGIDEAESTITVTNKFERLDIEAFHQNEENYFYQKRMDSGIEIEIDGRGGEFTYKETHPDSYFSIYKEYDSNGYIKEKGLIITHSYLSKIGIWYYYDGSGKLVKEVNWDKLYKFTFNDILAFCKKERIPVEKGIDFPSKIMLNEDKDTLNIQFITMIDRMEEDEYYWEILYYNTYDYMMNTISLDGQTGKVLSRDSGIMTR
jgi:hypothetical protein